MKFQLTCQAGKEDVRCAGSAGGVEEYRTITLTMTLKVSGLRIFSGFLQGTLCSTFNLEPFKSIYFQYRKAVERNIEFIPSFG